MNKKMRLFKNILVTGGAGFIGGCVIRKLLKDTNYKLSILDFMGYASDLSWLKNYESYKNRYEHFEVDLCNKNEVKETIRESNPDLILHLAAESHVDRSLENPSNFIQSNILGTFNLLSASISHYLSLDKSRKKNFLFHHISTDEVFGSLGKTDYFDELTPYKPNSPYSATKASSDHLVRAWNQSFGLPIIITNCSNNYGPYQFPEKLIPLSIYKALNRENIPIYGDGLNIRDWLYVEDHVDAICLAAHQGCIGESYCIGGFGERNNNELILLMCQILDRIRPIEIKYNSLIEYVKDRPGHDFRYSINSNKIQTQLGWKPKYNLEKGLEKTIKWYLKNQEWVAMMQDKSKYKGERLGRS